MSFDGPRLRFYPSLDGQGRIGLPSLGRKARVALDGSLAHRAGLRLQCLHARLERDELRFHLRESRFLANRLACLRQVARLRRSARRRPAMSAGRSDEAQHQGPSRDGRKQFSRHDTSLSNVATRNILPAKERRHIEQMGAQLAGAIFQNCRWRGPLRANNPRAKASGEDQPSTPGRLLVSLRVPKEATLTPTARMLASKTCA